MGSAAAARAGGAGSQETNRSAAKNKERMDFFRLFMCFSPYTLAKHTKKLYRKSFFDSTTASTCWKVAYFV